MDYKGPTTQHKPHFCKESSKGVVDLDVITSFLTLKESDIYTKNETSQKDHIFALDNKNLQEAPHFLVNHNHTGNVSPISDDEEDEIGKSGSTLIVNSNQPTKTSRDIGTNSVPNLFTSTSYSPHETQGNFNFPTSLFSSENNYSISTDYYPITDDSDSISVRKDSYPKFYNVSSKYVFENDPASSNFNSFSLTSSNSAPSSITSEVPSSKIEQNLPTKTFFKKGKLEFESLDNSKKTHSKTVKLENPANISRKVTKNSNSAQALTTYPNITYHKSKKVASKLPNIRTSRNSELLNLEDFHDLKIWLEDNKDQLIKADFDLTKLSQNSLEQFMKKQNISHSSAISKIQKYISLKKNQIEQEVNEIKALRSKKRVLLNKPTTQNSKVTSIKESKATTNDIFARLTSLTSYDGSGSIKRRDLIHQLIHEMRLCDCPKSKKLSLEILRKSSHSTENLLDFSKYGGVEVFSFWINSMAKITGLHSEQIILKSILEILSNLKISNSTLVHSEIGKYINLIVRSEKYPNSRYHCAEPKIISLASKLVNRWKLQLSLNNHSQQRIAHSTQGFSHFPQQSPNNQSTTITQNFSQTPSTSNTQPLGKKDFLIDLLQSAEQEVEKQRRRKLEYQNARLEGVIKQRAAQKQLKFTESIHKPLQTSEDGLKNFDSFHLEFFHTSQVTSSNTSPSLEAISSETKLNHLTFAPDLLEVVKFFSDEPPYKIKDSIKTGNIIRGDSAYSLLHNSSTYTSENFTRMRKKDEFLKGRILKLVPPSISGLLNSYVPSFTFYNPPVVKDYIENPFSDKFSNLARALISFSDADEPPFLLQNITHTNQIKENAHPPQLINSLTQTFDSINKYSTQCNSKNLNINNTIQLKEKETFFRHTFSTATTIPEPTKLDLLENLKIIAQANFLS